MLSLVTAVAVLTIVVGGTLVVVEDAFRDRERGDAERAVALQASERLVAADGPIADRPNVVNQSALATLSAADLRTVGASDRFRMAVTVDGSRRATVGDPETGHVVRRIVLVERTERVERQPPLAAQEGYEVTLPVRTDSLELTLEPPAGTTVTTVRSEGRVVLHDESGLAGTHALETARYDTLRLTFETTGPLADGDVSVAYETTTREKALLAVTVDDARRSRTGGEAA